MDALHAVIGSDESTITWWQMSIRAVLIFAVALLLVRLGRQRAFGKNTSFDIVLGVILGSILSRALTANAPLVPTIAAAAALVGVHRLVSTIAFRSKTIGHAVKGVEVQLVRDGRVLGDALRKTAVTEHDLREAVRSSGTEDLAAVEAAFLERSGKISVIEKGRPT